MIIETRMPNRMHKGKVRDTYQLTDDVLLMVATDRISAFDVVLPNGIPDKGAVLNRMSAFWFDRTAQIVPNHLIALADSPEARAYSDNPVIKDAAYNEDNVARQAMVVKKAERIDIECIVRGYITGSAWGNTAARVRCPVSPCRKGWWRETGSRSRCSLRRPRLKRATTRT